MRLLFVLEYFYPHVGGVETLFLKLTTLLAQSGHSVVVFTNKYDKNLPEIEYVQGVKVIRRNYRNRYLFSLLGYRGLKAINEDFDLIHTTSYNAGIPAWIYSKQKKIPCLITFHEVWGKLWFKLPFLSISERVLFYLFERFLLILPFNKVIGVSKYTEKQLLKQYLFKSRVGFVYNGLEAVISENKPNNNSKIEFLYYGRLGVSKGLDLLVPAFQKLRKENPTASLQLITPQEPVYLYKKIKNLVAIQNEGISWKGSLTNDELLKTLKSTYAVVIPSYSEGFGFVAAECSALNVPIITSLNGALPEVVSGKHIAIREQSVDAVYQSLKKATNNNWEMIPKKSFSIEDTKAAYLRHYHSLIKKSIKTN